MSKRINVNPDHYKVAGRERPGGGIPHDRMRRVLALEQAEIERWQGAREARPQPEPSSPAPSPKKPAAAKRTSKNKRTVTAAPKFSAARKPSRTQGKTARRKKPASKPKRAKRAS